MSNFTIAPAKEFTHILHHQNTKLKWKYKVMFALSVIKDIGKRFENTLKFDKRLYWCKNGQTLNRNPNRDF